MRPLGGFEYLFCMAFDSDGTMKPGTKENLKGIRNLLIGIPLALWAVCAFGFWVVRPVDGYFKPVFRDDGSVETVYFYRTTWWGMGKGTDYVVEFKHGRAFYEMDGRSVEIDAWKFMGN